MREAEIQAEILRFLAGKRRIRVMRNQTGSLEARDGRWISFGLVGSSDILGILAPEGRVLAIECKSAKGRESKEQAAFGRTIEAFGGVYILARSVDDVARGLAAWL